MDTSNTQKKTLKIKKAPMAEESPAPEGDVVVASMHANASATVTDSSSYRVSVLLAFLSLVFFGALMVLQAIEWSFFHRPPSAFPL